MPAFRLVGAQIRTVKYELGKGRPKGSAPLTDDQKHHRTTARKLYEQAAAIYLEVERKQFDDVDLSAELLETSQKACQAQLDWRKAHPSDEPLLTLVSFEPRRYDATRISAPTGFRFVESCGDNRGMVTL
jgi:hypothetical protein